MAHRGPGRPEGALYALPCFLPFLFKIFLGNLYLKILDLTKLFVADAPTKINKKIEILVQKPPMAERLMNSIYFIKNDLHFSNKYHYGDGVLFRKILASSLNS